MVQNLRIVGGDSWGIGSRLGMPFGGCQRKVLLMHVGRGTRQWIGKLDMLAFGSVGRWVRG